MTKALVLYATITGNNEDIADIVTSTFEDHGVEAEMKDLSFADVNELNTVDVCVVCPYTYDGGSLPDEGLDFFEDLATEQFPNLVFAVAGAGDTQYGDEFALAVDKFAAQLAQTGAKQGADSIKIDVTPNSDDVAALETMVAKLLSQVEHHD